MLDAVTASLAAEARAGPVARRGLMLVLSSPSGAGKTTLTRRLRERDANLTMSVSATTRPPRPGEEEGVHYHFVDEARFEAMRAAGDLLESASVFGNRYGTPRAPMEAALARGLDVVFDIDWQGTQQLKERARSDLVSVFVLPPSLAELERRLRSRAQDPEETVRRRMATAAAETSHWAEYDYVVVNDDVEASLDAVATVLAAERLRRERQVGLSAFVTRLLAGA